jgi:hypothetical protein
LGEHSYAPGRFLAPRLMRSHSLSRGACLFG